MKFMVCFWSFDHICYETTRVLGSQMGVCGELGNTKAIAFASEHEHSILPKPLFFLFYQLGHPSMYSLIL